MVKTLVAASVAWPLLLSAAVWERASGGGAIWTHVLYAAASRICHQRPERSFHTAGIKWPVCGRCSGLYLAAPVGAIAALLTRRRRLRAPTSAPNTRHRERKPVRWLVIAGLPTAMTLALEWMGVGWVTNTVRAMAAAPLGAMIAFVICRVAAGPSRAIE